MVIGASIAGLLAARVLHESFDEVIVLDRDVLPMAPQPRRGVPQGHHVHGLLARGRQELDRLFEAFSSELIAEGAPTFDVQDDMQWWIDGRPLAKGDSGMSALGAGRPLLEFALRRRIRELPNVRIRPECVANGLLTTRRGERVTGVRMTGLDQEILSEGVDLVVDASGRGSRARHWLAELGYPQAPRCR